LLEILFKDCILKYKFAPKNDGNDFIKESDVVVTVNCNYHSRTGLKQSEFQIEKAFD
jgi:hypothetical protein